MLCGDEVASIVGDIGFDTCKFGYAGEDMPKVVLPSTVGVVQQKDDSVVGAGAVGVREDSGTSPSNSYHIGSPTLYHRRDFMPLKNPMVEGLMSDWDICEQLWHHAFDKQLRVDPKEHPVVAAEPSFNTRANREKYAELIFEKFQVPALFIARNAVLAAFAFGRSAGLVVDVGASCTTVSPVWDGYLLRGAMRRSPVGGQVLTRYMQHLLKTRTGEPNVSPTTVNTPVVVNPRFSFRKKRQRGGELMVTQVDVPNTDPSYREYMTLDVVRDMKETCCVMPEATLNEQLAARMPPVPYELPDGTVVQMGIERYRVPELLIQPKPKDGFDVLAGSSGGVEGGAGHVQLEGLPDMLLSAVKGCDPDIRRELLQHVMLTGGSSVLPNTPLRLNGEMAKLLPATHKVRFLAAGNAERRFNVWIGGSVLSSLGTFQQLWLSKAEYLEHGATLVQQRFL